VTLTPFTCPPDTEAVQVAPEPVPFAAIVQLVDDPL
jgi:hypothetical protein